MQTSTFASVKTDSVAVALSDVCQKPISGKYLSTKKMVKGFVRTACKKGYQHRANVTLVALAMLCFALPHLAGATDLLAAQKQDAKDTFGHGSTVEWGFTGTPSQAVHLFIRASRPQPEAVRQRAELTAGHLEQNFHLQHLSLCKTAAAHNLLLSFRPSSGKRKPADQAGWVRQD